MGKFTIAEEAPSSTSSILGAETATQKDGSTSPEDSVDSFTLKTSQTRRRGRPPGSKNKPVIQAVSEAPADYRLWSQLFIGSANTVVVTWLGAECAMERREAEMLEPPVARILQRLPVSQSQKIATFIDPMVILIALGMWGNRIIRIQRAKRGSISDDELARASGYVDTAPTREAQSVPETEAVYQPTVEPDFPQRTRVPVNPNGIPVAITEQMGEV